MQTFLEYLTEEDERIDPVTYPLKGLYNQLNAQCFDGKLRDIPVVFSSKMPGKQIQGATIATVMHRQGMPAWARKTQQETIHMMIRTFPYRESKLKGIVAHEMCHVWNFQHDEHDRDQHGMYFRAIALKAQAKAGFKIPLTHESDEDDKDYMEKKPCVFLVMGKPGETVGLLYNQSVTTKGDTLGNANTIMDAVTRSRYQWAIFGFGMSHLVSKFTMAREVLTRLPRIYRIDLKDIKILKIYAHAGMLPGNLFS